MRKLSLFTEISVIQGLVLMFKIGGVVINLVNMHILKSVPFKDLIVTIAF